MPRVREPNPDALRLRGSGRRLATCRGFGLLAWLLIIPAAIMVLLILAIGFYEGRKAFWDSKVREMCAKDGGTRVHERVTLTKAEYDRLGGQSGMIPIPHEKSASQDYPFVSVGNALLINESNPRVYRSEDKYLRRTDRKVLATSVQYSRVGGDFPLSYAHPSSFACPDQKTVLAEERAIFSIEGVPK